MSSDWTAWLARWTDAGLIDAATAERIRAHEAAHAGSSRLRWPVLIAVAFGALMVSGGLLLFVAANWDALSPGQRFALALLLVGSFHVAGAALAERFPAMSETMHAIGTAVLGSGIALAGQIFHLDEHWPGGIMMWALGAGIGWLLLRHTAQTVLFAILTPAWLVSEWIVAAGADFRFRSGAVAAAGVFLLALAYLTASGHGTPTRNRRALLWLGAIALVPAAGVLSAFAYDQYLSSRQATSNLVYASGWIVALGGPLALSFLLRRFDAWPQAVATVWVLALLSLREVFGVNDSLGRILQYAWWAAGAVGLVAWGVRDGRVERINLGAAIFAVTVLIFYFSQVMDKLGRSASLVALGVLFLAGGWALERIRRGLVQQAKAGS